jgi:hypothetical protein
MRDLLMENKNYIKQILLSIIFIYILISCSHGQTTYQKYDNVTRGAEYHIAKSQIESNRKMIKMLNSEKSNYSVLRKDESISRSRIQGVISAKQSENFRLNQKAFMLMDANKIGDVNRYNANYNALKPTLKNNE